MRNSPYHIAIKGLVSHAWLPAPEKGCENMTLGLIIIYDRKILSFRRVFW